MEVARCGDSVELWCIRAILVLGWSEPVKILLQLIGGIAWSTERVATQGVAGKCAVAELWQLP